jgi:hypothetical protein
MDLLPKVGASNTKHVPNTKQMYLWHTLQGRNLGMEYIH